VRLEHERRDDDRRRPAQVGTAEKDAVAIREPEPEPERDAHTAAGRATNISVSATPNSATEECSCGNTSSPSITKSPAAASVGATTAPRRNASSHVRSNSACTKTPVMSALTTTSSVLSSADGTATLRSRRNDVGRPPS